MVVGAFLNSLWLEGEHVDVSPILGIISTALPSLTGNRGEYFRVVGILEMGEERGRYL